MWLYSHMPYPPKGARALRNIPEWENEEEFQDTYMRFMNQELLRYTYEGLPETCDQRFLDLSFIHYGKAMIAMDGKVPVTLHTNPYDQMNMYGYFRRATGWAWNGYNKQFEVYVPGTDKTKFNGNAVIGYDNPMRYPYHFYLTHLTERYMRSQRAIDMTIENLKTPYIIKAPEEQVETVKAAIKKKNDNHGYIVLPETMNVIGEGIEIWPSATSPQVVTEMWNHFYNTENLGRENRGITTNPSPDKRERQITAEVSANDMITNINSEYRYQERVKFFDLVNEFFDLDIKVIDNFAELANDPIEDNIEASKNVQPSQKEGDNNA